MARFEFETASDESDLVRGQCSLVVDGNGEPRIAYTTETGQFVIASRNAGTWMHDKVSERLVAAGAEDRVWLQIDSAGNPQVAYIEESTRRLIHGVRGPDSRWSVKDVPTHRPPHEPVVFSISFVLHPEGQDPDLRDTPHISFEDQSSNSLGYARKIGEDWRISQAAQPKQIDDVTSSRTGQATSLAFNESQSLQIAYVQTLEVPPVTTVHTRRVLDIREGTFGDERRIEEGRFFVGPTSIISMTPMTWVAYCDVTNRALKAGTFSTGGESIVEVVAPVVGRTVPVLAQNPAGGGELSDRLRIAYADGGRILLARRVRSQGWTVDVIDPDGGEMPSLAYDSRGNAHVAYAAGRKLRYAKGQPE